MLSKTQIFVKKKMQILIKRYIIMLLQINKIFIYIVKVE